MGRVRTELGGCWIILFWRKDVCMLNSNGWRGPCGILRRRNSVLGEREHTERWHFLSVEECTWHRGLINLVDICNPNN